MSERKGRRRRAQEPPLRWTVAVREAAEAELTEVLAAPLDVTVLQPVVDRAADVYAPRLRVTGAEAAIALANRLEKLRSSFRFFVMVQELVQGSASMQAQTEPVVVSDKVAAFSESIRKSIRGSLWVLQGEPGTQVGVDDVGDVVGELRAWTASEGDQLGGEGWTLYAMLALSLYGPRAKLPTKDSRNVPVIAAAAARPQEALAAPMSADGVQVIPQQVLSALTAGSGVARQLALGAVPPPVPPPVLHLADVFGLARPGGGGNRAGALSVALFVELAAAMPAEDRVNWRGDGWARSEYELDLVDVREYLYPDRRWRSRQWPELRRALEAVGEARVTWRDGERELSWQPFPLAWAIDGRAAGKLRVQATMVADGGLGPRIHMPTLRRLRLPPRSAYGERLGGSLTWRLYLALCVLWYGAGGRMGDNWPLLDGVLPEGGGARQPHTRETATAFALGPMGRQAFGGPLSPAQIHELVYTDKPPTGGAARSRNFAVTRILEAMRDEGLLHLVYSPDGHGLYVVPANEERALPALLDKSGAPTRETARDGLLV